MAATEFSYRLRRRLQSRSGGCRCVQKLCCRTSFGRVISKRDPWHRAFDRIAVDSVTRGGMTTFLYDTALRRRQGIELHSYRGVVDYG